MGISILKRRRSSPGKSALAGCGRRAGCVVCDDPVSARDEEGPKKQNGNQPEQSKVGNQQEDEPATIKAANAVSRMALHRELLPEEKAPAGTAVHYAFGAAVGGIYGALAEKMPLARVGFGTLFGSVLWLLSDEIAVPAAGFSKPPQQYPVSIHANPLASHLVYGVATEAVRAGLRAI